MRQENRHRLLSKEISADAAEKTLDPTRMAISTGDDKVDVFGVQTGEEGVYRLHFARVWPGFHPGFHAMESQMPPGRAPPLAPWPPTDESLLHHVFCVDDRTQHAVGNSQWPWRGLVTAADFLQFN